MWTAGTVTLTTFNFPFYCPFGEPFAPTPFYLLNPPHLPSQPIKPLIHTIIPIKPTLCM
ncbi:hypothetical protein B484DRAFT_441622 [Ochromonadaceae sp. CCMP2298]|nr:hypothetical protein B484DRAFT_441622 [Ochromonadaceae sp. CCMP2298]